MLKTSLNQLRRAHYALITQSLVDALVVLCSQIINYPSMKYYKTDHFLLLIGISILSNNTTRHNLIPLYNTKH